MVLLAERRPGYVIELVTNFRSAHIMTCPATSPNPRKNWMNATEPSRTVMSTDAPARREMPVRKVTFEGWQLGGEGDPKFANQIANQLDGTVRYQASQDRIIAAKLAHRTACLATRRHASA